jgi:hypothetical protein
VLAGLAGPPPVGPADDFAHSDASLLATGAAATPAAAEAAASHDTAAVAAEAAAAVFAATLDAARAMTRVPPQSGEAPAGEAGVAAGLSATGSVLPPVAMAASTPFDVPAGVPALMPGIEDADPEPAAPPAPARASAHAEAGEAGPSPAFADFGPIAHPFPLPPEPAGEFDPVALMGGRAPAAAGPGGEQAAAAHTIEAPVIEATAATAAPEAASGGSAGSEESGGEQAASGEGPPPVPLPVENVLSLSSYVLGRNVVDFEINAELHIFGRTKPGSNLQLFGRPVALRPDGTFSVYRPLPNGALVLSILLARNGEGDG